MLKKIAAIFLLAMLVTIIIIPASISLIRSKENTEEVKEWAGPEIKLLISATGEVVTLSLEEYLIGVVAAEMPVKFEAEALKAQAVAARTYTLKKMNSVNDKHPEADICDDPGHCQAWMSDEEMQRSWGMTGYTAYKRKIKQAVEETKGIILTYDNRLIEPVYHSTSGPSTENSQDVWQKAIPYLQSVACQWDKESPRYQEKKMFGWDELDKLLGTSWAALPASALQNSSSSIIQIVSKTTTGRAKEIKVGESIVLATELRSVLGLNSTNFQLAANEKGVTFTTTGFGHGVGMCQYGANGQAKEGRNFAEILTYYYSGVKLQRLAGYN